MRDPDYQPPRVERTIKTPGSKELICGEWWVIGEDGEPKEKAPA